MRINKLQVTRLFGLFSYEVPLNLEDRITIIHGPNGCGKTSILRMLYSFFGRRFGDLRRIRFSEMIISFENGVQLRIERNSHPQQEQRQKRAPRAGRSREELTQLEFSLIGRPEEKWTWVGIAERLDFPLEMVEAHIGFLSRIDEDLWRDRRTDELLTLDDIAAKFGNRLPFLPRVSGQEMPAWLREVIDGVEVHFIQTQRLLRLAASTRENPERAGHRAMVSEYADDAMGRLKSALAESAQQSQVLDRQFLRRVLETPPSTNVSSAQIRERYDTQQEKRKRLENAGLIKGELEYQYPLPTRELADTERPLLWLYLDDMEKKLSGFDELLEKIEVLQEMINARFLHKKFKIDRERGFEFTGDDGTRIPLEALSSGEQHELVLTYELLFHVKRGSLILIDEPELSLHVAWQQRFLDDLGRISKLAGLDFLVATHSPQIIHKRWDLAVSLGESE